MQEERIAIGSAVGTDVDLELVGVGSRAYAYVIDWHIRVLGLCAWYLLWWLALGTTDFLALIAALPRDGMSAAQVWLHVPAVLAYTLYHPVVELALRGQSPGKHMAGVAVVDEQGLPPGSGAIALRNVMRLVDGLPAFYALGIATTIISPRAQRLGDMVAGTLGVVRHKDAGAALDAVDRTLDASISPELAELTTDVLERWSTLTNERRRALSETILRQARITPEPGLKQRRHQLRTLLES